jgi:UDP-glucose 4-epimerase
LQGDDQVLVYDNFVTGSPDLLPPGNSRLDVVEGDILDHERLLQVMLDWAPSVVIHLAALHYIPYCNAHPLETLRVNVEGTQSVLQASRQARVGRIVFASSAAVYGISDRANHESSPPAPTDIYGQSKWFGEILLDQFHQDSGIACLAARLFNVYGCNETNPHVIPAILEQLSTADELELGNVDACRDFIYVKDVAQALIALAKARDLDCGIFNVGTGREHSIRQVVRTFEEITGRSLHIRSVTSRRRRTERWHLLADVSRIVEAIGWRPWYDLRSGLTEILAAMDIIGVTQTPATA